MKFAEEGREVVWDELKENLRMMKNLLLMIKKGLTVNADNI